MKSLGKTVAVLALVLVAILATAEVLCRTSKAKFYARISDLRSDAERELPLGSSTNQAIAFLSKREIPHSLTEAQGDSVAEEVLGAPTVVAGGMEVHTPWCYNWACSSDAMIRIKFKLDAQGKLISRDVTPVFTCV
jgi:hypothetical protein